MKRCENCGNYNHEEMMHTEVCCECTITYTGTVRVDPSHWKPMPQPKQTNADRIRAMSDEGLAKFMNLCGHDFPPYCDVESSISEECDQNCIKCAEEWLKQPAEGE